MSFRLENLIFDAEKNDFLIVRGGRFRSGSFTEKGEAVIKMEGFSRYFFDPETCQVYSRKARRSFEILKKMNDGAGDYYFLYLNGIRQKVTLFQILRDNMKNLELFFHEESRSLRPYKKKFKLAAG